MERFEKIYLNRWRKEIKSKGCDMEKNKGFKGSKMKPHEGGE